MRIIAWIGRLLGSRRGAKRKPSSHRYREELFPNLFVRQLEERRVLNGTPLTWTDDVTIDTGLDGDDGAPDTFYVVRDGDSVRVSVNGTEVGSGLLADVTTITLEGSTDADTLIVDLSGGDPFPSGGIFFDGADGGGDLLMIEGTPLAGGIDTVTHRFDRIGEGFINVAFDGSSAGGSTPGISYTGVESITDATAADHLVFEFGPTAETVTLSDDGDPDDDQSLITSSEGTPVTFATPGVSLLVATDTGSVGDNDTVNVEGLDSQFDADLSIRGGAEDTADFTDAVDLNGGDLTVFGGAIAVNGTLRTDGGDVLLESATTTTLNDDVITDGGDIVFADAVSTDGGAAVNVSTGAAAGGNVEFQSTLSLGGDLTVTAGSGNVTFQGTIDDDGVVGTSSDLVVNSSGTTRFNGTVGGGSPIESVTTDWAGTTELNANITTNGGTQTFNDPLVLTGDLTVTDSGATGVFFNNTVNGDGNGPWDLTVVTTHGASDIQFNNTVGNVNALDAVTITNAGTLTIAAAGDMNLVGAFLQNGAGSVSTAGDIDTSDDNVTFTRAVTLTGAVDIDTTGTASGNILFSSTIDMGGNDLDLDAGPAGNVTLSGAVSSGGDLTVRDGAVQSYQALTVNLLEIEDAMTSVMFHGDIAATTTIDVNSGGAIVQDGQVTSGTNLDYDAGSTIEIEKGITVSGTVDIDATTSVTILADGDINAGGAVTFGAAKAGALTTAGDVDTSDDNVTFTSAVTLSGNVDIDTTGTAAGDIWFKSTIDMAGNNLDLDAGPSGNVTLSGRVSSGGDLTVRDGAVQSYQALTVNALDIEAATTSVTFNAAVNTTSTIDVTSGGTITVDGAMNSDGSKITMNATSGLISILDPVSSTPGAGGTVTITGAASIDATITAGAGDIEINGSTAGTSDLDIDADITSSGTINFSAPRDILVGAKLETTATDADIILTADSETNGVGGVRIETAGLLDSEDDVALTGSDLFITGGSVDSVRVDADGTVNQIVAEGDVTLERQTANVPVGADMIIDGRIRTTVDGGITVNAEDDATGVILLSANLTAAAKIDFQDAVQLTGGVTLTANDIDFDSTLDGAFDLVLADSGTTTVTGAVGSGTPLGDGVGAAVTIESLGTTRFESTVTAGSGIVQLDGAGEVTFWGDVTVGAGDTASDFRADVTFDGMTYTSDGAVTLGNADTDQVSLSGGAVWIRTTGAGDTLTVNATIGGDQDLTLDSGEDVLVNAGIGTGGGSLSVLADGALVMAGGSSIDAGSGMIELVADEEVTLGSVETTTTLLVTSVHGAIGDTSDANIGVGGAATFGAFAGITLGDSGGSDTANFGSLNLIGTAVAVTEDSSMLVTGVVADSLALTAAGAIEDSGDVVVAGAAVFNAGASPITLGDQPGETTNFGSLTVVGGAVEIYEDSDMLLVGADVGTLDLESPGDITTQGGVVRAQGLITLYTPKNIVVRDIAALPPGASEIVGGEIVLTAGEVITIENGAVLESATGKVTNAPPLLRIGEVDPDDVVVPGDRTQDLTGTVGGIEAEGDNLEQGANFTITVVWDDGVESVLTGVNAGDTVSWFIRGDGTSEAVVTAGDPTGPIEVLIIRDYPISYLVTVSETELIANVQIDNDSAIRLFDSTGVDLNWVDAIVKTDFAGEKFHRPPEMIEWERPQVVIAEETPVVFEPRTTSVAQVSRFEETRPSQEEVGEGQRELYIVKVGPDGVEGDREPLPDTALSNLKALFDMFRKRNLPNGVYRIYLEEPGFPRRLVIEFYKSGNSFGDPVHESGRGSSPTIEQPSVAPPEAGSGDEVPMTREEDPAELSEFPNRLAGPFLGAAALAGIGLAAHSTRGNWERDIDEAMERSEAESFSRAARLRRRCRW